MVRGRRHPLHFNLPQRLKEARERAGLDRKALSLSAGLSHPTVWAIEAEGRIPGLDTVEKIAGVLGAAPCLIAYGIETVCPPSAEPRYLGCGARVQQLREHLRLTKQALAAAATITGKAVTQIESGRVVPSVATVESLAIALDVSPCWLAYGCGADPVQDPQGAASDAQVLHPRRRLPPPGRRRVAPKSRR